MDSDTGLTETQAPFEREVEDALHRLRLALSNVIRALPNVSRAIELHRTLGIDRNLSWRIFRVATATNPLTAGTHVPRPANLATFHKAAAKRGVPSEAIERSAEASAEFERVVKIHAGDRATFESMVSGLAAAEDTEQLDFQHRRSAFRGNRHIWGVYADVKLRCSIVQPNEDPSKMDYVQVDGSIGLKRLRQDARLIVACSQITNFDGDLLPMPPMEPIDSDGDIGHGVSLLRDFCTQPLPPVHTFQRKDNCVETEFESKGVGNTAAVDCLTGWLIRKSADRYRSADNTADGFCAAVRLPCRVVIHDILVRRGTYPVGPRTATTYMELIEYGPYPGRPGAWQPGPFTVPLAQVGRGPLAVQTPEIPRYPELAGYIFDRLGWDADEFDVYRCRVEYPILPCSIVATFDLAEAPD